MTLITTVILVVHAVKGFGYASSKCRKFGTIDIVHSLYKTQIYIIAVLKYKLYFDEGNKTRQKARLAEPSLRFRLEPKCRLYFKIVIMFVLYPATWYYNCTFYSSNELYSTKYAVYLHLKAWHHGVNKSKTTWSHHVS